MASYKAQRGWQNLKFENIEPQFQESVRKQLLEAQLSEPSGAADISQLAQAAQSLGFSSSPIHNGLNGHTFRTNGTPRVGFSDDTIFKTPSKKRKLKAEHDLVHSVDRHHHKKEKRSGGRHHKSSPLEKHAKKKKRKHRDSNGFHVPAETYAAADFTDPAVASEFVDAATALASLQQPQTSPPRTPRTPRTPPPHNQTEEDAAQLMLFLATSPSPARTRTSQAAFGTPGQIGTPIRTMPLSPMASTTAVHNATAAATIARTSTIPAPSTPPRGISKPDKADRPSFPTTPSNFSFADYLNVTPSPATRREGPGSATFQSAGAISRRKLNFEDPFSPRAAAPARGEENKGLGLDPPMDLVG